MATYFHCFIFYFIENHDLTFHVNCLSCRHDSLIFSKQTNKRNMLLWSGNITFGWQRVSDLISVVIICLYWYFYISWKEVTTSALISNLVCIAPDKVKFMAIFMSPTTKGGGTYCFWDGSRWRQRLRKTSCPLCNLNTHWNILMILSRNVEQDQTTCRVQEWQLCLSYFWSYHPLFYLKKISCLLCNSNT